MSKIESALYNVGFLENQSSQDTPIHRLDPRAKLITTIIFIFTVVSSDKYEITNLLAFFIFPVTTAMMGNLSLKYICKNLLYVSPFAVLIGIFNPIFDQKTILVIDQVEISGGWVSFLSIILRFMLTMSAALILIGTSGLFSICVALERLKIPRVFVVQLMFLYRYIFVLIDETIGLVRARALRSFKGRGMGISVAGSMIGQLLLRTINRARRIYLSMLSRGFDGEIRLMREINMNLTSFLYIVIWSSLFIIMRNYNIPVVIGEFINRMLS